MVAPASYAMFWWIGEGPRRAGRIEIGDDHFDLAATTPGTTIETVPFPELAKILLDRNLLHVERVSSPPVHIGSLDTPGALRELAERLSNAADDNPR